MERTLVLDNGAGQIKAALVCGSGADARASAGVRELVIPNALARVGKTALAYPASKLGSSRRPHGMLVGSEIGEAPDFGGMSVRRAHERGVVTSWDVERDVWQSLLSADRGLGLVGSGVRRETGLVLTEALGVPLHTRAATDELVFEECGFGACGVVPAARLVARGGTALVLDSGFSFSHAVPVERGWERASAARRLGVGGKVLTNRLKTTVSYRSWNMMDEGVVMDAVKERVCFVSTHFGRDLAAAQTGDALRREYLLPDASLLGADPLGHVRRPGEPLDGSEQVLVMNNERFSVPELLFRPGDAGFAQAGVAELVFQAVEACPDALRPALYANIVLTGGNCLLPNFQTRLLAELRPLVDSHYDVRVRTVHDPIRAPMRAAVDALLSDHPPPFRMVTRQEYEEEGSHAIAARFFCRDFDP